MKMLILGQVWPEPVSSAAGSRMMQLIEGLQTFGGTIYFASASQKNELAVDLKALGIVVLQVKLNDNAFDELVRKMDPALVVFDRFMTEEQYGWRIAENCPHALRILDTEDLHGLRKGREEAYRKQEIFTEFHLLNDYAKREIASIYRCDLSLIISEAEMDFLTGFFGVPEMLLLYLPFMVNELNDLEIERLKSFGDRKDFMTIGNFRHEPNWQAVNHLKKHIWPFIRKELPVAAMHVYGSYPSEKHLQLQNSKEGFYIHGRAENAHFEMSQRKVLLASLVTGAGLKGKLLDAMQTGTPVVTTSVGAEGLYGNLPANGVVQDEPEAFAKAAVRLHKDEGYWEKSSENGFEIINQRFSKEKWIPVLQEKIRDYLSNLNIYRLKNFTGTMLQHQSLRATKYMSKWIEEKNK